ncbi:MAG: thiamine phosphate synthase [Gammaproteobacteria bacterium]|nr:thiamine phosphate synthase [Gammaproteobacteria bacterium]
MMTTYLKLCLVTERYDKDFIQDAIHGGVTLIQYRDKTKSFDEKLHAAKCLKDLLNAHNIPFIINDNIELAKIVDADGVHLGQLDRSPEIAREILGPDKIIGLSIENLEQLDTANQLNSINYVAASALFPTPSKTNCEKYWGLDGLKDFVSRSIHPVITIGGIALSNVFDVMQCGVVGVAVISAIESNYNPEYAARQLMQEIVRGESHARKT